MNPLDVLDPAQGVKPLDFGADGVTGSLDPDGRLIAVNTFHPAHGYVTLTTADPFPEDRRYDPAEVRRYRAGLAALEGFGPRWAAPVIRREVVLLEGAIPRVRLALANGGSAEVTTFAHGGGALQLWRITGTEPRWAGQLSLQRSAYTQLTEGGPVPMPPLESRLWFTDGLLTVENPALPFAAAIAGPAKLAVPMPDSDSALVLAVGFGADGAVARQQALALARLDVPAVLDRLCADWRAVWRDVSPAASDPLVRRGLVYGLALAVPVGETRCLLTDHMLLPLSWNRDAYYVARALLSARLAWADVVRRHLLWMFETAERPGGTWGRCYMANGRVKDAAFQLDQQLFPLLELADYVIATGDSATRDRLAAHIPPLIAALLARKAPEAWLFPTDETPADDPVTQPYHLSSHILMWRTLRRLTEAGFSGDFAAMAESVRAAVGAFFVTEYDGRRLYAYTTDGRGAVHRYHDANDIPLVLAPAWGFIAADDPVWRATVAFAFSEANPEGFYPPALGSVHTRAPWPLGDVQEIIMARATDDPARAERAYDRLRRSAQWDGALPEAYDAASYAVVSRNWFAWPNAALACVQLGAFDAE